MDRRTVRHNTRALLCILGVFTVGSQATRAQQCTPRAVVIGISVCKDTEFKPLAHATDDAFAFRDWFQKNTRCGSGLVSAKPVVTLLTDDAARQGAIMRAAATKKGAGTQRSAQTIVQRRRVLPAT